MEQYERIKEYCQTVCNKIRFKGAKPAVYDEIESHICDLRDAYMENGDSEESATDKAIVQMGDPITVGMELDKVHRPSSQWQMLIGVFVLAFASAVMRLLLIGQGFTVLGTSVVYAGAFIMLLAYFYGFDFLHKHVIQVSVVIIICYFALRFFGIKVRGENHAAIGILTINFAYGKLLFPFLYGVLVYRLSKKGYRGLICCGVLFAVMLIESSVDIIYFVVSSLALTYLIYKKEAFYSKKHGLYLLLFMAGISLIAGTVTIKNYFGTFNSDIAKDGMFYTDKMINEVLKGAAWWGKGSGPEIAETLHFSKNAVLNSYIILSVVHNFGWVWLIALALLFMGTTVFCAAFCLKTKDLLGQITGIAALLAVVFQAVTYTLMNLGIVNIFPANLSMPLVSAGNTASLLNFLLIGLMLSAFRNKNIVMKDCKHHIELQ